MSSASNLPYIVIEDFWHPTEQQKQKMIAHVNAERLEKRSADDVEDNAWTTSTWLAEDEDDLFRQLHEMFLDQIEECFGKYQLRKKHRKGCFGYTSSNRYWAFDPHQHPCEVNAVYYLNLPKTDNELWGALMLCEDPNSNQPKPWDYIIPKEGMLVLMPGWLWHDPLYVPSKEHRISINLEAYLKRYPDAEEYHEWNKRYV